MRREATRRKPTRGPMNRGILHCERTRVDLRLRMKDAELAAWMPAPPALFARRVAERVAAHEREHALGYYPALEHLLAEGVLGEDLSSLVEGVCAEAAGLVRARVARRLRGPFSQARVVGARSLLYNMPAVRPGADALARLRDFYVPGRFRIGVELARIYRAPGSPVDGPAGLPAADERARLITAAMHRWLSEAFDELEVVAVRALD